MNDSPFPLSPDDPRLTSYALGQMEPGERAAFEVLLEQDEVARRSVEEIRHMADQLQSILRDEPEVPLMLAPQRRPGFVTSLIRFPQGYYAAGLAAAACFALYLVVRPARHPATLAQARAMHGVSAVAAAPTSEEKADAVELAPFDVAAGSDSYDSVRQMILGGRLPSPQTVRTEAYVDAFGYAYAAPLGDAPFSVSLEAARSPWAINRALLRVGLRARDAGDAAAARNVILRLSLDPARVARCRLIGYGDAPARAIGGELDFPVGELRGSIERTLLFELEPAAGQTDPAVGFVSVDARYVDPADNQEKAFGIGFPRQAVAFGEASASLRFAAAVARFGTLLKHLPADRATAMVEAAGWAEAAAVQEPGDGRLEFVATARKAAELFAAGGARAGSAERRPAGRPANPL